jgi:hypothetical protein
MTALEAAVTLLGQASVLADVCCLSQIVTRG